MDVKSLAVVQVLALLPADWDSDPGVDIKIVIPILQGFFFRLNEMTLSIL